MHILRIRLPTDKAPRAVSVRVPVRPAILGRAIGRLSRHHRLAIALTAAAALVTNSLQQVMPRVLADPPSPPKPAVGTSAGTSVGNAPVPDATSRVTNVTLNAVSGGLHLQVGSRHCVEQDQGNQSAGCSTAFTVQDYRGTLTPWYVAISGVAGGRDDDDRDDDDEDEDSGDGRQPSSPSVIATIDSSTFIAGSPTKPHTAVTNVEKRAVVVGTTPQWFLRATGLGDFAGAVTVVPVKSKGKKHPSLSKVNIVLTISATP